MARASFQTHFPVLRIVFCSLCARCVSKFRPSRYITHRSSFSALPLLKVFLWYYTLSYVFCVLDRLDVIRKCIVDSGDSMEDLLLYTFTISQKVVDNRDFRKQVLTALIELYRSLATPDYISMCQCLLFLNDHQSVADVLNDVILNDPQNDGCLVAYQVAFELAENQHQPFLLRVCAALPASDDDVNAKAGSEGSDDTDGKEVEVSSSPDAVSDVVVDASAETSGETSPLMGGDNDANSTSLDTDENSYSCRLQKLKSILRGNTSSQLYLRFLYSYNHSDLIWLGSLKDKLDPRNSVTHNALVMTHSLMHLGTSIDVFLRDNMEWLGKAKNWAKFNATASMGVIHQGHHEKSRELLDPYLPKPGKQASPYQEGGALYALGLIHANHNGSQTEYLLEQLREAGTNEIKQHGACLGLGLSGMATGDAGLFQALNAVVSTESAVAGEAAGIAMGLVLLGMCCLFACSCA